MASYTFLASHYRRACTRRRSSLGTADLIVGVHVLHFCTAITDEETVFLANLIRDHHSLYLRLFPDRQLKPKHHFLTHYASSMRQLGPLSHLWVMRFEAKHNFFCRLSHIVCNFQNIAKTLSYRNQINLTYNLLAKKTLSESNAVGPGTSVLLAGILEG